MDRDRPSDADFAAALHEANRILRGEPMLPAAREDIRGRLLRRAMLDRRLNVARTMAAFVLGFGVGLLVRR